MVIFRAYRIYIWNCSNCAVNYCSCGMRNEKTNWPKCTTIQRSMCVSSNWSFEIWYTVGIKWCPHYIQFVQPMCVSLSHTNKYIYKAIPKTLSSLSLQTFIMQFLFKSDLYFIPHYIRLLDSFEVCHMPSISLRIHLLYHRDLISPCTANLPHN